MGKYTPGPWKLVKKVTPGQFGTDYQIRTEDNGMIAEVGPNAQEANAALIATAPELFECLKKALHVVESEEGSDNSLSMEIRAALAKARGAICT